ncbi:ABC transporter substrate-binding protein [Halegenticoccus tardaugens]|uniref:ABC transporter substrate-binding protein n=1 Tax=Halegenticoccus tardaugens TaxID=2071624 RepID=UPI00100AD3E8|nr:extracellular solute-binding protein [Halegenticoccus tardaugens]
MNDDDDGTNGRTRRTVVAGLGALGTTGLAGCISRLRGGSGGNGSQSSEGNGEGLTFWTTQVENDRKQVIRDLLGRFESQKSSSVQMISIQEDDLPTRISSARASDTLPVVGEFGLSHMQKLGSNGVLSTQAADDVIESIGKDKFYQGVLDLTQGPDGAHFAIPMHGWLQGFWYSQSVFEEHGLDRPTTWDSLLTAAETLHKPDQNQFGIVVGTKPTSFARQCFTPFARSNDARVFDENGEIVFDSEKMVEALEFYARLAEFTPPGKDSWETANNTYLNDQCHLVEYSTYLMGDVGDKGKEMVKDSKFAPHIENKRKSSFGQVVALNLFKSSSGEELKQGKTLSEFFMTGDAYIDWLHMAPGGMNPVLKPVAESDEYQSNETLEAWGSTVEDISGAFENIERFGYVNGEVFPEFGEITNQFHVAEAVSRVTDGEDAQTVASEQAEKMRQTLSE